MHVHHEGLRSYAAWSSKLNIDDITLKKAIQTTALNNWVNLLRKFAYINLYTKGPFSKLWFESWDTKLIAVRCLTYLSHHCCIENAHLRRLVWVFVACFIEVPKYHDIMSVDSLISIEPVHTHCMHARIQNILSEGVVRVDRNATKNGPPLAHQRNAFEMAFLLACQWPTIECWLGSFVSFRGSGSILLGNPIFLWFFRGGGGGVRIPCTPSGSAHGMHLKGGTCLKCSVIIGRKVGLDHNLVCLFAPGQARDSRS